MKRVLQIPNTSSTYNATNQRIYRRFHRKPQVYPNYFQTNKSNEIESLEDDNMNNLISDIYKQKKFRGMLDPTSPNNKNIFIDTDSEVQKSERAPEEFPNVHNKKSTQLLITKTESQFPETYNSQNIFKRDGLVKGYYIKVNPKNNLNSYEYMNNRNNLNEIGKAKMKTPEPDLEENIIYDLNLGTKTQIRPQKRENKYLFYTDNNNYRKQAQYGTEIERNDWNSVEARQKLNNNIYRNKDIQLNINPVTNKINANQVYKKGIVYKKNNVSYSKSNISDLSIDINSQQKKQNNDNINNYIIKAIGSDINSPNIEYKNISNENDGDLSNDLENQNELFYYNEQDYNNYKEIEPKNTSNHGGKVDLYFELVNNKKNNIYRNKNIIIPQTRKYKLVNIIKNDDKKMESLIKLQRFIKSYIYLREICAMKIQSVWRGCNTRKIMDLYNDLDEFIYHLSKVQFNHFNNDFCFFIKQLFNIYKASVNNDNENYNEESNEELENNDNKININNDIIDDAFIQERQTLFDPEKLEIENEIALVVEGETKPFEKTKNLNSKDYYKLKRDYDDLYQQYNELKNTRNNNILITTTNQRTKPRKEKNESESTIGSVKSDYKFRFMTNSRDNTNYRGYSEIRHSTEDKDEKDKNLTFSNDYDADLDINRDDDFFNQEMSYDDKDNSGSQINDKKYNYYNIHSDENSKYFDNEDKKEGEMTQKNNKNNSGKKTNTSKRGKNKYIGLHKHEKNGKNISNNINSPSLEKSTNYMGHHSKTFQRKYQYKYSEDNNELIIPKHEEEFNIINTNPNIYLSPKENIDKKFSQEIAITPNNRYQEKNWNDFNENIKNEEISFKYNNKNKKDYNKIIDDKDNEIIILQNKLNEIKNKSKKRKIFDENLEINNNLNEINIKGIKTPYREITKKNKIPKLFTQLEPEGIKNNRFGISLNIMSERRPIKNNLRIENTNSVDIKKTKLIPHTIESMTDTYDLMPKEIKITTKKVVKKTNYLRNKSYDNVISLRNEINIKGNKMHQYLKNNKQDEIIKNDEFSLINIPKREIKLVTKKILKKTNYVYSRFKNNKTMISSQSEFDIRGNIKLKNKNRFNELDNRMSYENIINLKGIGKKFNTKKIILNKLPPINYNGRSMKNIKLKQKNKYENIINKNSQFKLKGKTKKGENVINKKVHFKIDGIHKELAEKNFDTSDLIQKEIKITTKKVVRKTNIIKPKINYSISSENHIMLEGLYNPKEQEQEEEKEYKMKAKNWKEQLKKEVQQNKFIIKRISKNVYKKLNEIREIENKLLKKRTENIVDNNISINIQGLDFDEEKYLTESLKTEEPDISSKKKERNNNNNIIVRKIKLNIISNKSILSQEPSIKKIYLSKNWNDSLKEETLHSKFTIKKKKSKKYKNEIEKNIEIIIEPIDDISKTKNKIVENWNEMNSKEKSEEINIEKQPKAREIKITTKKILKKTNYIYKRFENANLKIDNEQLNIEGKKKISCSEYSTDNSKININIDQAYEQKLILKENNLISSKENEIFINSNEYKKREIKITTKKSIAKTKFIYKRFKNIYISKENEIKLKGKKNKLQKLEKYQEDENHFTINKAYNTPNNDNLIEEMEKESEKLKEENEKLKNEIKTKEEEDLKKKEEIKKEEKTTDTLDLEKKEIKITTKKIIKKTNIINHRFKNNSICENMQLSIDNVNKLNNSSEIQLIHDKLQTPDYNNTEEIFEEKNQLDKDKLPLNLNKLTDKENSKPINLIIESVGGDEKKDLLKGKKAKKTTNKKIKLKTVVVYIDKKYDLKNCFNKWNNMTLNMNLKNDLKTKDISKINKKQPKSKLILDNIESNTENDINEKEIINPDNKTTEDLTNYDTINLEGDKTLNTKTKSSNNDDKGKRKKKKIKIKYVRNSKDNSLNNISKSSDNNNILLTDESNNSINENKYSNRSNEQNEMSQMKSLESKSTKKPFILRINKVEVKKKILSPKVIKTDENEELKNKELSRYNSLIVRHFFQIWQQNKLNNGNEMHKLFARYIIDSLVMKLKINKFKIYLIKYAFKKNK